MSGNSQAPSSPGPHGRIRLPGANAALGRVSASANCSVVAKRSAGTFANARLTACSTESGNDARTVRSGRTGSVMRRAVIA